MCRVRIDLFTSSPRGCVHGQMIFLALYETGIKYCYEVTVGYF